MTDSYLAPAPAPRQLDILADTALTGKTKNAPGLSTKRQNENAPGLSTVDKTKNTPGLSTFTQEDVRKAITRIESRRVLMKISISELCTAAGIRIETYDDARLRRSKTRAKTIRWLEEALDWLAAGRKRAPQTLCMMSLRLLTEKMAVSSGWDPKLMLSQNFASENSNDPVWLQASRLRRCAIYLLVEEMRVVGKSEIAQAIGISRQAVHKGVAAVEAERERDSAFNARMQEVIDALKDNP